MKKLSDQPLNSKINSWSLNEVKMIFKSTCKQASKLISMTLDEKLIITDNITLKLHLLICKPCRLFKTQLNTIHHLQKYLPYNVEENDNIQLSKKTKEHITKILNQK